MHGISAVLHDKKVYIMAGSAPDTRTKEKIYCYNITTDDWELLPKSGHFMGILHIIDGKLNVIGGQDTTSFSAKKATSKVSSLVNNIWTNHFPNMSMARLKPGVVSHSEYVIVAGGKRESGTVIDTIEILNTTQPSQWIMTSILLPEPMWAFSPTISDNMIIIVGYSASKGRTNKSYQLSVDKMTSFTMPPATSDQPVQWMQLPSTPHFGAGIIPNSHPPVIMGGKMCGFFTADVVMLDYYSYKWKKMASLSSFKTGIAVLSINSDTILVLGGSTGQDDSITTVEKGRATLTQAVPATPTEDTRACSIV